MCSQSYGSFAEEIHMHVVLGNGGRCPLGQMASPPGYFWQEKGALVALQFVLRFGVKIGGVVAFVQLH